MDPVPALLIGVAIVALACEYLDASIGMGYGTTLTPLLLTMGFAATDVVPAVLVGQLAGGLVGTLAHYRLGNIRLDFRRDDRVVKERLRGLGYFPKSFDSKVIFVLSGCGAIGALIGVFTAVNIPEAVLTTYIGALVLSIGVYVLIRGNRRRSFSWTTLTGVGLLSAFNKSLSGGGYGPLVTGGQIVSGRGSRRSVGSTTMAEVTVCLVGVIAYLTMRGSIDWPLAAAATSGSVVAAPLAALTVKRLGSRILVYVIGTATVILGVSTLLRLYVF